MCGICGAVQLDDSRAAPLSGGALDVMTDALTHRGPDSRGTYRDTGVVLGARRLAIVDVEHGNQPMTNEDGTVVVVQNGEIYNHVELHRQLERDGHRFVSRCDTEVIPHLYERYGVDFVDHIRGMFAIAVWDARRQRAVLVRDRVGVKPLYYAVVDGRLVFASELKSLLASGVVPLDLDVGAIDAYLALGYFPAPSTPLAAVRKLIPGYRVVVEHGKVRVEQYWKYPVPQPATTRVTLDDAAAEFMELIDESVRMRMMSDVPVGAFLSGGLDSSLVVGLMARESEGSVRTFAVGVDAGFEDNELADARAVARHFGTDHTEIKLSLSDATTDLEELVWHLDEPVADFSAVGMLALSKRAAEDITVALTGQGADELFGGYDKHRAAQLVRPWRSMPSSLRKASVAIAGRGSARMQRVAGMLQASDAAARHLAMSGHDVERLRGRDLQANHVADVDAAVERVRQLVGDIDEDAANASMYVDALTSLPDDLLHYFDRTSMAHSLEVRVPFLDPRLVEFAARLPLGLKLSGRKAKVVVKRAARSLVPSYIIDKPKISFMRPATNEWLLGQLASSYDTYFTHQTPGCTGLVDIEAFDAMVAEHRAGQYRRSPLVLAVLLLEIWLSSFLPRAQALAAAGASADAADTTPSGCH
jgi:asparagine synthase (glutamine-hydrolysing)